MSKRIRRSFPFLSRDAICAILPFCDRITQLRIRLVNWRWNASLEACRSEPSVMFLLAALDEYRLQRRSGPRVPLSTKPEMKMEPDQDSPFVANSISMSFGTEYASYSSGTGHHICANLHLVAPKLAVGIADARPPLDLVCCVDRSGSMSGSRIALVKQTLEFIVEELTHPNDRLGIVVYGSDVQVVLPLVLLAGDGNRRSAVDRIRSIQSTGMTNLSGGLEESLRMLLNRGESNEIASVLLFTDGRCNRGLTDAYSICNLMSGRVPDFGHGRGVNVRQEKSDAERSRDLLMRTISFPVTVTEENEEIVSVPVPAPRTIPVSVSVPQFLQQPTQMRGSVPNMSCFVPPRAQQQQQQQPQQQQQRMNFFQAMRSVEALPAAGAVMDAPTRRELRLPDYTKLATVNALGFGTDHDATLLQKIAKTGNGLYYFIDQPAAIAEAFVSCIGGLTSVVGKDLEVLIEVEVDSSSQLLKVFTDYEQKVMNPGKSVRVRMADLQSEEERDLFFVLTIPQESELVPETRIARFQLRYLDAVSTLQIERELFGFVVRQDVAAAAAAISKDLDEVRNRLLCSNAILLANEFAVKHRWIEARNVINEAINVIQSSPSFDREFVKALVQDMKDVRRKLRPRDYFQGGQQQAMNTWHGHSAQRTSNTSMSHSRYTNCQRTAMLGKLSRRRKK